MIALLEKVAQRTMENGPFLGVQRAQALAARLASLPDTAPDLDRWRLYLDAGRVHAHLGDERQAIKYFSQARQSLAKLKMQLHPVWANRTRFRLGLAYLRMGETQNCCLGPNAEACILPIQGGGVHRRPEGSTEAIRYFTEVLENSTKNSMLHLKAKWLLNIAHMTLGRYPEGVPAAFLIPPEVFASEQEFPKFVNIAPRLKFDTFNLCGGAIVDNFNKDDYLDILTSTWDPTGQTRLFINNQDGTFSDRTDSANLIGLYGGLNLVQADYNNDGNLDVFVMRGAWRGRAGRTPNSLLCNNGDGTFTDVTFDARLGDVHYPTSSASWADYDNDGDLDLYVGNEQPDSRSQDQFDVPCQLFRNNGDGTFTDIAARAGVKNNGFTKGVIWGDYNADRWSDLYVSNLGAANRLYRNNGDGTFTDVAAQLGVTRPEFSFPVWFWDFDNDGNLDLYVSSFNGVTDVIAYVTASYLGLPIKPEILSCLYRGDGQGGFKEVAQQYNLTRATVAMGANFGDLDNDGYLDFYLGTGYPDYEALMPNVMYRNCAGKRFADVTTAGGFGHLQKGHGIAFVDLDQDGDQDVYEQMGGAYPGDKFHDSLYENPGFGNHWISIHLIGTSSNRSAIGVRIHVQVLENGRLRSIYKHVNSGGSFGANPLRQTIGLGKASKIERLEIYWPTTNLIQTFTDVTMNQLIQITESHEEYETLTVKHTPLYDKDRVNPKVKVNGATESRADRGDLAKS